MSPSTKTRKSIYIFLAFIFAGCLAGILVAAFSDDVRDKDSFSRTIINTLLTIISVTVIGTLAALLMDDYNREQTELSNKQNQLAIQLDKLKEKRLLQLENTNQFRKDVLATINKLYVKVKNARRMLRAKGFVRPYYKNEDNENLLILSVYDEAMDDVNSCQLELESIREEINASAVFAQGKFLVEKLDIMEEYLGAFVTEYEKNRPAFEGNPPVHKIGPLSDIKRFLAHANEGGFISDFSSNYKLIKTGIRNEIIS